MKVLVGLGNPGAEYEGTRHNLGFEVVRKVASRLKVRLKEGKGPALSARTSRGGDDVLLVCPLTYMNDSGEALARLDPGRTFDPAEVLVVCDDLALPTGRMRLRASGSDGGHRGLRSIEARLGSAGYPRLRIGIGASPEKGETRDFVLEKPAPEEQALLDRAVAEAVHGVVAWLDCTPLAILMNRINRDPEPPARE
ncbi:MAG TPA: aminoacyl-tRNA hydrolase [Planctomycetota bacterium]|jgi:PTH1 family peptidyl-tRNA hydrolase|nr:aminoacyl-tRNA hydrolase [Planctomycetota bacterium]